jgi:hypothetical protein
MFLFQIYILLVINSAFKVTHKRLTEWMNDQQNWLNNQKKLMDAANSIFEKQKRFWAIANGDLEQADWDTELDGKSL